MRMAKQTISYWILFFDAVYIPLALLIAYEAHAAFIGGPSSTHYLLREWGPWIGITAALWAILYFTLGLDGFSGGWQFPTVVSKVGLGGAVLTLMLFAVGFLGHVTYSRFVIVLFACLLIVGFLVIRAAAFAVVRRRSSDRALRRVVILGNGNVAHELARKIQRHPELLCEVVGFLFPGNGDRISNDTAASDTTNSGVAVTTVNVVDLLRAQNVNEVVVALPDCSPPELQKLVTLCRSSKIGISLVPQWYELYLSKAHFVDIDGLPMLSLVDQRPSALALGVKRAMDIVLGGLFLILAMPVLTVSAVMLMLRGRRCFKYELRCGYEGQLFRMYRLNIDRDRLPPLRGVERLLAMSSLTELPQLWNVLRGEMTLVGPRPEAPLRVQHYSDWQRQRLTIKPGLTGLAQVHGLREEHTSEDKARFDLQYMNQRSLFLDITIVVQTCWTLATRFRPSCGFTHDASPPAEVIGVSAREV